MFRDAIYEGVISAGTAAVTEVVSALLFAFYRSTNDNLAKAANDLRTIQLVETSMEMISKIQDPASHDEAIKDLLSRLNVAGGDSNVGA
jgi:hypothetical protein